MAQKNISLEEYIVENAPKKAQLFVKKYGYKPSKYIDDLIIQVHDIVSEDGKSALKKLASIHPDKELILWANQDEIEEEIERRVSIQLNSKAEVKSNVCGCGSSFSGFDGYSNCSGNTSCSCNQPKSRRKFGFDSEDFFDANGVSSKSNETIKETIVEKNSNSGNNNWIPMIALTGLFLATMVLFKSNNS